MGQGRDAAKHSTVHKSALHSKDLSSQNVNSAEVESIPATMLNDNKDMLTIQSKVEGLSSIRKDFESVSKV